MPPAQRPKHPDFSQNARRRDKRQPVFRSPPRHSTDQESFAIVPPETCFCEGTPVMNTIGTRVASGVTGSVNGFSKPGQTNERKKQDDETVITTCSAKTVKWSNVSKSSMAARHPNGQNLYGSIEAFVRDQGRSLLILLQASVNHARLVDLARSVIRPRLVENLSDEELIQQISAAVRNASRALPVVPEEIPVVARVGSGEDSGISSTSNVSRRSMEARHPNEQNLYSSIEAFVRDEGRSLLIQILLQASVTHASLVELARSVIRPRIVENLSDEELIQQISAAVRNASRALRVVPEEIPVVARAGSGEDSGISSVTMHQAEGNDAVGLEIRSVGTFSIASAQSASEDNVIAARQLLAAEPISTSSSECQNSQANSSRGESHALSQQQRPQNEDQTDEAEDERKQPAQKKPRVDE
jgi:hypothetical protein